LLLLHGYLSSKEAFTAQIAYFSRFYRVTALDLIGFGNSAPLTQPFSVADYAEWTKGAMAALGVKKPHVIAHSFGCRVAVKLASLHPGFFDKVILTGPAGIILKRGLRYHLKVKAYRLIKRVAPRWAEKRFGSKEYRTLSPIMKESYKKIVNEDLRKCAGQVCNEVLILQGKADKVTTEREALIYLNAFPNARIRYIDGGHFAFAENATQFCLLAEEFLYE
jgi:pimeloyl-ACP methyl ester carboxylesterase